MIAEAKQIPQAADHPAEPEYEKNVMVRHLRVGAWLVIALMPVGFILDYAYYHDKVGLFFAYRVACSLMVLAVPGLLRTRLGCKYYQALGLYVALLPAFFICLMIYKTEGAASPYYAGLNLILLAIAFVLRWSVGLSLTTLLIIAGMYLAACFLHGIPAGGAMREAMISELVNNLYFLGLTGVIVVTGSTIHHRLRVREHELTQKLETKKMELELSNKQLEAMLQKLQTTQGMLVEAEKRRAIGVLAGGIIHDIGNTLTHTRTNLYALKKRILDIPADKQRVFSEISSDLEHGIKQAMSTVTLVRTYTHPNMESREQVDVKEIVDSALLLTSSRWRESNIFTQVEIQPGTTIWGNKQSLVDVLVNLILNSADALLCKKFKDNEDPVIRITGGVEAGRVLIRVHDNGTGIPENIRDKVFDPYYTTKDIDKGSGLGLSMSRKTVEQFDGRIAMRSETGSFCEFTLDFPVTTDH